MSNGLKCRFCGAIWNLEHVCPAIASDCSAADGGASGCEAPAEIRSVPPIDASILAERVELAISWWRKHDDHDAIGLILGILRELTENTGL